MTLLGESTGPTTNPEATGDTAPASSPGSHDSSTGTQTEISPSEATPDKGQSEGGQNDATPPSESDSSSGGETSEDGTKSDTESDGKSEESQEQQDQKDDYDLKAPEGFQLNEELSKKFKEHLKADKLSPEQAQKYMNFAAEMQKHWTELNTQAFENWKEQNRQETLKKLGARAQKELAYAGAAIERFGNPQLREVLDTTGLGNHPDLVEMFAKIGRAASDHEYVESKKSTVELPLHDRLFSAS